MEKKYEFTGETRKFLGKTLYRIRALVDIGRDIKAGDLGGWIESERNLSQEDDAWVMGQATVMDYAEVMDHARVSGQARISDHARIFGNAWVSKQARISDYAEVSGCAWVSDYAWITGHAWISDFARVMGQARVSGVFIRGYAKIIGQARIYREYDYIVISPIGSRNDYTTFCHTKDGSIIVVCGCFQGNINEFEAIVKKVHGDNKHGRAYMAAIQFVKSVINTDTIEDMKKTCL